MHRSTAGLPRTLMACCCLWVTVSGCGSTTEPDAKPRSTPSTAVSTPAPGYVERLNLLCVELERQVIAVYGGQAHPRPFPIEVFNAEQSKLEPVIKRFDAQAGALPVAPDERGAARAFEAYRRASDAVGRTLATAAASGDQAKFDAAFHAVHESKRLQSAIEDADALGIYCNAR